MLVRVGNRTRDFWQRSFTAKTLFCSRERYPMKSLPNVEQLSPKLVLLLWITCQKIHESKNVSVYLFNLYFDFKKHVCCVSCFKLQEFNVNLMSATEIKGV